MVHKEISGQLGLSVIITDKLLDSAKKEELLMIVRRQMMDSMINKLIIDGKQAFNLSQESQRDASLRAFELITVMETLDDNTYEALLGKMQYRQDSIIKAMESVNNVPWWRLLWFKVSRKKIVESSYA